jgi:tetratricopeptide (TPR) repeat protein
MLKRNLAIGIGILLLLSGLALADSLVIRSTSRHVLNDPNLYLSLGDFLLKNGYEESALKAYEKALELEPENKAVLNNLGYYYREKNPLLAQDYFYKALETDKEYQTARYNLALLYNSLSQYDRAVEQLEVLILINPDNINYNYDLAINLANKYYYQGRLHGDLIRSIEFFKKVHNMDPGFMHTIQNIKVLEEIRRTVER